MIRIATLLASALLLGAAPKPQPQRILSLEMCDDLLLLMIAPPSRIASITYLAHPAVEGLMPGADRGIAINHGSAEEIAQQRPDLVIGSPFAASTARRLAASAGARIVTLPIASDFAGIRQNVRTMGMLVGAPERAEAFVRSMDGTLRRLAADRLAPPPRLIAWNGSGDVPGRGTLTDAIIRAAGARNIAARGGTAAFGVEELLAADPDAILLADDRDAGASLHRARMHHPLIERRFAGRQITYAGAAYACGLPQSATAAADLQRALRRLAAR